MGFVRGPLGGLRITELASAVPAFAFDVVFLRKRRDSSGVARQLTYPSENDLGAAVVAFPCTIDLDFRALQATDVSDPFQVAWEDDDCEWTETIVLAEVEEVYAAIPLFHAQYFPGDAFGGADVLQGVGVGDTIAPSGRNKTQEQDQDGKDGKKDTEYTQETVRL